MKRNEKAALFAILTAFFGTMVGLSIAAAIIDSKGCGIAEEKARELNCTQKSGISDYYCTRAPETFFNCSATDNFKK